MKKASEIIMSLFLGLTIIATITKGYITQEDKRQIKNDEQNLIEYLEHKYGDGNFKIEEHEIKDCPIFDGCKTNSTVEISTDYLDETFTMVYQNHISSYTSYYGTDPFLEELYLEKWAEKGVLFTDFLRDKTLNNISKDIIGEELSKKIKINFEQITFDYKYTYFEHLPEVEDLIRNANVSNPYFSVEGYMENDLETFKKDIITSYEALEKNSNKYNFYIPNRIGIRFNIYNPYDTEDDLYNTYYSSGYIRKETDRYLLYLSPTPIEIERN